LKARPEEAAHVGDLPETDLAGARAAGMRAILFLGVTGREDGRGLADAVFEDYCELERILEGWE
jgi:FMN phosphatase YigB (HAD superfamily)